MLYRCDDPNDPNYGGRGIGVYEPWRDFDNFLADMGERPADPPGWTGKKPYWSLDRINPDGDYEPTNCRWVNAKTQRGNLSAQ